MIYIGVSGSREFKNKQLLFSTLDNLRKQYTHITLVSGGARGADKFAEEYAKKYNLNIIIYEPDWELAPGLAGFIRNQKIAEKCDILVACLVVNYPCHGTMDTIHRVVGLKKQVIYIASK
jgi:hypothetical protein